MDTLRWEGGYRQVMGRRWEEGRLKGEPPTVNIFPCHSTFIYGGRSDVVCVGDEMRPYCQAMGGKREVGGVKKGGGRLAKS